MIPPELFTDPPAAEPVAASRMWSTFWGYQSIAVGENIFSADAWVTGRYAISPIVANFPHAFGLWLG